MNRKAKAQTREARSAGFSCAGYRKIGFGMTAVCPLAVSCSRVVSDGEQAPFVHRWSSSEVACAAFTGKFHAAKVRVEVRGEFS